MADTQTETAADIRDDVRHIVVAHAPGRESLIPVLQDVQQALGYVPERAVAAVAEAMALSESEIYGVLTFYTQFRLRPPGKHAVCVCQGTACHVRGGKQVLDEFERRLGVRAGETSEDGRFHLERVACIGCCALAPTVTVDGRVHAGMTPEKVKPLLDETAAADTGTPD